MSKQLGRDQLGFFLNGLVNNFTYVVFLSAAQDILKESQHHDHHEHIPESAILLADILPGLAVKIICPYFMHALPYRYDVTMVAWFPALWIRLLGIVLASASSGLGEVSFLALTSFYDTSVVGWWGSGTGAAGIGGALIYLALTTWLHISLKGTLLVLSVLPFLMLFSYGSLMSKPHLAIEQQRSIIVRTRRSPEYRHVNTNVPSGVTSGVTSGAEEARPSFASRRQSLPEITLGIPFAPTTSDLGLSYKDNSDDDNDNAEHVSIDNEDNENLADDPNKKRPELLSFGQRIRLLRPLLCPYMLPLFWVYFAEYTINQGIAPVLLFPVDSTPFASLREHYVYYQCLYQLGVFLSRSSISVFPIRRIWVPSLLQVLNLAAVLVHVMVPYIPSVWVVMALVFWEGLLGGATYVNAFYKIARNVDPVYREFSMGATAVADTLGITVAGLVSLALTPALCAWQVQHGSTLCKLVRNPE